MSRIHKQVVSVQKATDGANSGATLGQTFAAAPISKHSAFYATATRTEGVTFSPIFYSIDGATIAGTTTNVKGAISPLYFQTRLHSFTGLTGGDLTFLA